MKVEDYCMRLVNKGFFPSNAFLILFVTWKGVKEMSRIEKQSYDHKALFVSKCVFKLFFSCKSDVQ